MVARGLHWCGDPGGGRALAVALRVVEGARRLAHGQGMRPGEMSLLPWAHPYSTPPRMADCHPCRSDGSGPNQRRVGHAHSYEVF